MHIRKNNSACSLNKVHKQEISEKNQVTYLGTILASSGKFNEDIDSRYIKGISSANQILNMVNEHFIFNYFESALVFRNSILINSVLFSLEANNYINKRQIERLESCDKYLFSKLFLAGSCAPALGYYWETGAIPLQFILMGRRLMYFWEILHKSDKEIVKTVIDIQQKVTEKNDWIYLIQNDLSQCGIKLSNYEIFYYSKFAFKNLLKQRLRQVTSEYLTLNKTSKLSGLTEIKFQDYLRSGDLTLKQKRLLYKFRLRMVEDIRDNYKSKFSNNLNCPLCGQHYDDQPSLFTCSLILSNKGLNREIKNISYSNIFKSIELQVPTIKVLEKIMNFRNKKINN